MCFFQLEAMIKFSRIVPFTVSTSLKNESVLVRIVPCTVSTSLKNESGVRIVPCTVSTSLKNESVSLRIVLFLCQPP